LHQAIESTEAGHHALHMTASGWRDWGAGFGVPFRTDVSGQRSCAADASAFDGIRFRARGVGSVRVNVTTPALLPIAEEGTCDLGRACYDWPGAEVQLTPEWKTYELRFCGLSPVGWGRTTATVDRRRLHAVHFRLAENQSHDVWLDDLAFFTTPPSAPSEAARCGPTCPLAAAPPDAVVAPALLSPRHAAAGLTVHTFAQPTKSCGPLTRRYLAYVPARLRAGSAAPVLIILHGYGASAESFRDYQTHGRFEALAERDGFITIYTNAAPGPASSVTVPNSGAWREPPSATDEVNDVAYLDAVLDDLRTRGVVDGTNPVFLVGQSLGGGMVIEAARQRPDRYAGFAAMMPFAGLAPRPPERLAETRLARVLFAYSLTDPGLPPGYVVNTLRPLVDGWAAALGIPPAIIAAPARTALPDRVNEGAGYQGSLPVALATRNSHGEQLDLVCPSGAGAAPAVRVLSFDHAGHFWPHAQQDTLSFILERWGLHNQDIDAADAIWAFFRDAALAPRKP
jgi:polyhydroxybutyrate depolymerase